MPWRERDRTSRFSFLLAAVELMLILKVNLGLLRGSRAVALAADRRCVARMLLTDCCSWLLSRRTVPAERGVLVDNSVAVFRDT